MAKAAPPRKIIKPPPKKPRKRRAAGRPEAVINWPMVELARTSGCSWGEAAATVGVHRDTLISRAKKEGKYEALDEAAPQVGRAIVKMKLLGLAKGGTLGALIHLDNKATQADLAAAAAEAASAAGGKGGPGGTGWLVETRPQIADIEQWSAQYGPMRAGDAAETPAAPAPPVPGPA